MAWKQTTAGREPTDARNQELVRALRKGRTYAAIAEEFGISITRVAQIRAYAGIERRRKERVNGKPRIPSR